MNTGQRRRRSSSPASTGCRVSCAVMHGPSPTVNCNRSASAAVSELAPERYVLLRAVHQADPDAVHLQRAGAGVGQPHRQQFGPGQLGFGDRSEC